MRYTAGLSIDQIAAQTNTIHTTNTDLLHPGPTRRHVAARLWRTDPPPVLGVRMGPAAAAPPRQAGERGALHPLVDGQPGVQKQRQRPWRRGAEEGGLIYRWWGVLGNFWTDKGCVNIQETVKQTSDRLPRFPRPKFCVHILRLEYEREGRRDVASPP